MSIQTIGKAGHSAAGRHLSLVLVAILFRVVSTQGQQPLAGSINGIVRDQAKSPIAEVALTATNLDDGSIRFSVSDRKGAYQFVDLPPGSYSIRAQKIGYRDYTVAVVTVATGENIQMGTMTIDADKPARPS
jgi:hypothetical protein